MRIIHAFRTGPASNARRPSAAEFVLALSRTIRLGAGACWIRRCHDEATAEFLSAEWLAERIRAGLPLGRVQALIGVEGHPAQELRGLHAWLARFLPGDADQPIEADPYGVLTCGDAGSLSPTSRRQRATLWIEHSRLEFPVLV